MGGGPELQNGDAPPNSSDATVNPASNGQELSSGSESTSELTAMLVNAGTTWSAATNGSQSAATYELASNTAVMAIGGWSSDPAPTLDQFRTEEHTSELQSLMRISYAVFCLKKKKTNKELKRSQDTT